MSKRQIMFDAYGNMLFPGYAIINEEGHPLCGKDSEQVVLFYTEDMAQKFLAEHPGLAKGARIIEYTFTIPEGDADE